MGKQHHGQDNYNHINESFIGKKHKISCKYFHKQKNIETPIESSH